MVLGSNIIVTWQNLGSNAVLSAQHLGLREGISSRLGSESLVAACEPAGSWYDVAAHCSCLEVHCLHNMAEWLSDDSALKLFSSKASQEAHL